MASLEMRKRSEDKVTIKESFPEVSKRVIWEGKIYKVQTEEAFEEVIKQKQIVLQSSFWGCTDNINLMWMQ